MSKKIEAVEGARRGLGNSPDDVDEHVTETPFDRLPDEIVVAIIVALGDDLPTVVRCAQTCKRHHVLAMDAVVWRPLCESRFGPPLHRRFLDVGKTWRWLCEAQARVTDGDTRGPQTGAMLVVVGFAQWIYWGDVVDGMPEGYGLALPLPQNRTRCPARVPDDSVTCQQQGHYEGYWHDGKRHGYGVEVTGDGRSYAGQWEAGKYHGYGVCTDPGESVYNGAWCAGYRCGHGSIAYSNGDRYEGNWHAHQPHGHGVYTWASGATYEGAWQYDTRHGHGSFIGADGMRYDGDWENDRMHGCGSMVYVDGCHYTGDWSTGKRHGYGLYTCTQGSRYDGQWQDDAPHGYGESVTPIGPTAVSTAVAKSTTMASWCFPTAPSTRASGPTICQRAMVHCGAQTIRPTTGGGSAAVRTAKASSDGATAANTWARSGVVDPMGPGSTSAVTANAP